MQNLDSLMRRCPVIPVIVVNRFEDALPLATALVNGGLSVLEITLRTAHGLGAISLLRDALPDAVVGAGTVTAIDDVARAVDAGAQFLVSPGSTPALLDAGLAAGAPLLPGVSTPSEAMACRERGVTHLKFFPAQAAGGVAMLKSIGAPLPDLKFCPTGGITPANAADYLALPNVLCVGGTWMLDSARIAAGDWAYIETLAQEAAALGDR